MPFCITLGKFLHICVHALEKVFFSQHVQLDRKRAEKEEKERQKDDEEENATEGTRNEDDDLLDNFLDEVEKVSDVGGRGKE